ncbi:DUF1173 domain-containing protein [Agrobacterium tumefaciens]|uniref:DUF1173 domain-containing protein n=1 Tax=Agrobacterium tumefaciens TaxID=358 RepID=A0AA44F6F5_AGRTU|nr:DUF1173 domain-containing protein [Agrobacterium tumefaciens]NTB87684.1 DUF1173 domain-containing protein [Agrobacterium tumefaciens]NTC19948.1 DUF1173 domain-containing protein [Agrobacterium tumefaciens]NTC29767.1 DUF1173 domain-containing protein [Agrobacterium tumefaciens]
MSRRYRIGHAVLAEEDPAFGATLTKAYWIRQRPVCLCCEKGVEMYIARISEQYFIKRMPLTGSDHDPLCQSYEPPYELSGLGPLIGGPIQLDQVSGTAALKLDFSLSKRGAQKSAGGSAQGEGPVKNEVRKLSLRALLHFLWHQGGLTEWTAHWAGKRHWFQVRSHLLEAAATTTVKGSALSDRLLIPENFRLDEKAAIEHRRAAALADIRAPSSGLRKLMVLIGEVKEFASARSGQKIIVKHMPGFPLMMEEGTWRRLQSRYAGELELWRANDRFHLVVIATFGMTHSGLATIDEIALMSATEQWLPIENAYEHRLIEALSRLSSKSVKGLRFNMASTQPIAAATLPHRRPMPAALYIIPPDANEDFEATLSEMISARDDVEAWVWRVAEGEMPPLPLG